MTLYQIIAKDTYRLIYGDFLKFRALVVISTTTIIEKCQTTDFLFFSIFFFAQEQSFFKLVNFAYREGVVKFLGIYGLFHGARVRCISSHFYLSLIFFSGSLHHKYLGKNRVAHCFPFLGWLPFL
jgi:hypothetical protein